MTDQERQLLLEHEGVELGIKKYRDNKEKRHLTDLSPGLRLMKMVIEPFCETLTAWCEEADKGHPTAMGKTVRSFLQQFEPAEVAFLTGKRIINTLGLNSNSYQAIAVSIADMLINHLEYKAFKRIAPGYVYVIETANRWATESHRRATLLRAKRKLVGRDAFDIASKVRVGSKCIEIFIESTGLVEKLLISHPQSKKDNYQLCATAVTQEWIAKAHDDCELLQPMYFPMIVPPVDWDSPVGGGFLTNQVTFQLPLMKTRDTHELLELGKHRMPQVYRAINTVQQTAWRINQRVADTLAEVWNVGGRAGLPERELPEIPAKPWRKGEQPPKKQLLAWKKIAAGIHETHARERSKRIAVEIKLFIARKMRPEPHMYFVWTLDWRGRMYPVQQFVNPQTDDSGRALLEFAEGKVLGEEGAFWLAVHGANTFGFDKTSFEERVAWVIDHEPEITACNDDPLGTLSFWEQADDPFQFLAFCFEWAGYKKDKDAFVSHLPVSFDGSCNGLQNFSAMLLDEIGGKATNLLPQEIPSDIYEEVALVLRSKVAKDIDSGVKEALPWKDKITRKITKRGVMTTPYGVTRYGLRKQLQYECEKIDKNYLGITEEIGLYYGYLSNHLYDAIGEVVIAARTAMVWLQQVAEIASQANKVIRWTTPVGFTPCQDYRRQKLLRVDTLHGGIRVQLGLWQNTPRIDRRRMFSGISPNFVHSLDASHLMLTINKCRENGLQNFSCVHDSYGTLAADATKLAYYLREAFIEQYGADVLKKFREEIAKQIPASMREMIPPMPKKGGLDLEKVRESCYFFA